MAALVAAWAELSPIAEAQPPTLPQITAGQPDSVAPHSIRLGKIRLVNLLTRPLFRRDRKPGPVAEPPPTPTEQQTAAAHRAALGSYHLSATVVTGAYKVAIIAKGDDTKLLRLTLGDEIEGWHVTEISARTVTLRSGTESAQLLFPAFSPSAQIARVTSATPAH
jgi:hypothetical protein